MAETRREHYRINYPTNERPKFVLAAKTQCEIVNLSEKGVKFVSPEHKFAEGQKIKGRIVFPDGKVFEVAGKVLRIQDSEVVLLLENSLPLDFMMEQQRLLIKKYGTLPD